MAAAKAEREMVAGSSTHIPPGSCASSSTKFLADSMRWSILREHMILAGRLWLVGFKDACRFHRAVSFCKRSRTVFVKTGQCFLLNGCIFLGSIWVLHHLVVPSLRWLLSSQLPVPARNGALDGDWRTAIEVISRALQSILVGICYVFWLYPLYVISFVVNCIWYNEIARHAFEILDCGKSSSQKNLAKPQSNRGRQGKEAGKDRDSGSIIVSMVLGIGEQIYSVIMVSAFFVEVFAVSYIPVVGQWLNFLLLSWLYAYYCFDYKWGFARWSLEKRLYFFETHWAFFAGFGSPVVLATFCFSPFVSAGVMSVLFPLFVLVATASNPEDSVRQCIGNDSGTTGLIRLPVFYFANKLTLPVLQLLQPSVSSVPSSIQSSKKPR